MKTVVKNCDVCGRRFDTSVFRSTPDEEPGHLWGSSYHQRRKRCSMKCESDANKRNHREWRRRQRAGR